MNRFVRGKRRQLLSLLALGVVVGLLALARSSQPASSHDMASGPVTAGYWDEPQLLWF